MSTQTKREFISNLSEWNSTEKILSIIGPTAAGKTSLALKAANNLKSAGLKKALLVSVDAVAVYKELDIGSAKPLGVEKTEHEWAGVDLVDCSQKLSASDFLKVTEASISKALLAKRPVIFVGGSFFYERMLVEGAAPGKASDVEYIQELENKGAQKVYKELQAKEPSISDYLHPNDEYRIFRYADLILRQGLSLTELKTKTQSPFFVPVQCLVVGEQKAIPIEHYLERIDLMFEQGWVDEVKGLRKRFSDESPGLLSIGYQQVVEHLRGEYDFQECRQKVAIAHRQLAKKQRTWLRGLLKKY